MRKRSKATRDKSKNQMAVRERRWWRFVLDLSTILACFLAAIALIIQFQTKPLPVLSPSDLHLQIGSLPLYSDEDMPLFLGIEHFEDNAAYLGRFPLVLRNAGRSTAQDISIVSKFPRLSRPELFDLIRFQMEGPLRNQIGVKQDFQDAGVFSLHIVNIDRLNPEQNMSIDQALPMHPTKMDFDVEPSNSLRLPVHVEYGYMVEFSVGAQNIPEQDYKVTIRIVGARSKDELSDKARQFVVEKIKTDNLQRPWVERTVSSYARHAIVGFTVPKVAHTLKEGKVYDVGYSSVDFRILTITLKPQWPTYVLWIVLPTVILILCYRLRVLTKTFTHLRGVLRKS